MDTVYRIYAGVSGVAEGYRIENRVAEYFNGFSIFTGTGHWRGRRESCTVIEILCNGFSEEKADVLKIASWIKTTFCQESVAVTESQVKVYFVGKSQ